MNLCRESNVSRTIRVLLGSQSLPCDVYELWLIIHIADQGPVLSVTIAGIVLRHHHGAKPSDDIFMSLD